MEAKQLDNSRFKKLRQLLKFNQSDFAEKLGTHQQTIAMIENNKRGVPSSIRENFYKVFGFSYDDAVYCETEEQLSNLQQRVLSAKNSLPNLDSSDENMLLKMRKAYEESNYISIPYYSAKAAAGEGIEVYNYPEKDVIHFDKRYLHAVVGHNLEHLSLITAEGDSMQPTIKDGELLMVDDSIKEIRPNKIFVIRQGDKLRVKRLKTELTGETLIISDNPIYPIETMNKETEIIGQVVWNGSKEIV